MVASRSVPLEFRENVNMNDLNLDDRLKQASEDLEKNHGDPKKKTEEEEEEDYLDPSRWWFASTACPLVAGTFGPIANAFSICALVQPWREFIPAGISEEDGVHVKDPHWLTVVNAISLALCVFANVALLLNMTRRLSFAIAQSVTIIGWFIGSFLLIALIVAANTTVFFLEPRAYHALTQAYYYAILAAILYIIVASLMVVTVYGAIKEHYPKEFRLSMSQRTLMLQTIAFMGYLLLGAVIYTYVEDWNYLDAVYWADFTLLTIGIGDNFVPKTHLGRSLLFPFAFGGILTVGLVVGSIRSLVLERGARKLQARFVEKNRESTLKSYNPDKHTIKTGWFGRHDFSHEGLSELQRRQQEFYVMRKVQETAHNRRRWMALAVSMLAGVILWFIGAAIFWAAENKNGWTYFYALYFSYTSLLTIGYGDLAPDTNSSKPFFVFWTLLAIPTLTILISNMGDTVIKAFSDLTIWLGALTILPGERGFKKDLKEFLMRFKPQNIIRPDEMQFAEPPGFLPESSKQEGSPLIDHALERLSKHLESEELQDAREAEMDGDIQGRHVHLYRYILTRELRHLMQDASKSPNRKYSYAEWAWYLRLLGQDESNPDFHVRPRAFDTKHKPPGWDNRKMTEEGDLSKYQWSWLGVRSPLMSDRSEGEWLIKRISAALQRHLAKPVGQAKPPVSFAELLKMRKQSVDKSDSDLAKNGDGCSDVEDEEGIKRDASHMEEDKKSR